MSKLLQEVTHDFSRLIGFYHFLMLRNISPTVSVMVNPAYTSLTCHHCLHIHPVIGESYRNGKRFVCGHCGWHGDADLNGARNIKTIGLSVIQPGGSWLSCEIAGGLLKLPGLMDAPALYRLSGQPREDVTHTTFS